MLKVTRCLSCDSIKLGRVTQRSDGVSILSCSDCGAMMVELIDDQPQALYKKDYFEKSTTTKQGYVDYFSSPVANLVGKYAFARLFTGRGRKHVDLGCADGSLMEIFTQEGFITEGVDISAQAVEVAQAKGQNASFSDLSILPDAAADADIVTCFDLLEHISFPGEFLKTVSAELKNGGVFVFSTLSVKHRDSSEYWFNNSLEHYVYYDHKSLANVLERTFGHGNYGFIEEDVNGVAEFWGFAKKGQPAGERHILDVLGREAWTSDPGTNLLISLFYNQVSKFSVSREIIDTSSKDWSRSEAVEATFLNYYCQGKFEKAVAYCDAHAWNVPISRSVFWQAVSYAQTEYFRMKTADIKKEYNEEVLSLRETVFKLRDELNALNNSRVLGRIIKARDFIGSVAPRLVRLPRRAAGLILHKVRLVIAPITPRPVRKFAKRLYRRIRTGPTVKSSVVLVANEKWSSKLPILSVVIPYFNAAVTIEETITSLEAQTYGAFETIIVDDGSLDEESTKILKVIEKNKKLNIKVIHQENQGVAAARNRGITEARGRYIICLDSDDMIDPTYIEKSILVLETQPDVAVVTFDQDIFGVVNKHFKKSPYDPLHLDKDNMVIVAAAFRKAAWAAVGGYKSGIGYEDWEYWLNLSEMGFWGKLVPEGLFKYRTSMQSRYVEDKEIHWSNVKAIRALHPNYKQRVKSMLAQRRNITHLTTPETAFTNIARTEYYALQNKKPKVLITIPWMTFGGAETLIYNYCREVKDSFDLTFVTGIKSSHEWEYKFKEITQRIYHMPNLFNDKALYVEFLSNYIATRNVDILHIIHNGFVFDMLPVLKKRHPKLRVIVTMFNDRVEEYVKGTVLQEEHIDVFTADSTAVVRSFSSKFSGNVLTKVIPNGINCTEEFSNALFDRAAVRRELGIGEDERAVFFVGRLSEEKNPDVFLNAAREVLRTEKKVKFFIIGDGPMRAKIEDILRELPANQVTDLGYQSEVARYLSAADIFVLPSAVEGFPLSILEAMAMGVAVIASRVGAIPDVIQDDVNGYVVTPGSVKEVTAKIKYLVNNAKVLDSIKKNNRKAVEDKYSNKKLGANYSQMYLDLLK